MAIQDYKTGIVSNLLFIPLMLFLKLSMALVIFFIIVLITFKYISNYIGGADIKIFSIFLGIYDLNIVLIWLVVSLSIALVYSIITKQQSIRMFPFFLGAYLLVLYP